MQIINIIAYRASGDECEKESLDNINLIPQKFDNQMDGIQIHSFLVTNPSPNWHSDGY